MPTFSTALSGLAANGAAIDVVGNNLANMNTTGFKASSTAFRDLVGDSMAGPKAANGQGVGQALALRRFTQGSIQGTQGSLDSAISGNGFFLVRSSQGQQLLTRAGNFRVDAAGNLVTLTGENVQGWNATNGNLSTSGAISNILLPAAGIRTPLATTAFSINANLDAGVPTGATFSTPVEIVDSLGATHVLTVTYTKTGSNAWGFDITIPAESVGSTTGPPASVATGTLTFNAQGRLTSPAAPGLVNVNVPTLTNGAAALALNLSLFEPGGLSRLTQFAQPSATSAVEQNGAPAAQLVNISIAEGGRIVGEYSNGRQVAVGQLALASLRNPDSLTAAGNNNYKLTQESGALAIGTPNTGGRGNIVGQSLEGSTVDIAREFTNLMVYQRGYQANSKVISAVDDMTQSVINLIR